MEVAILAGLAAAVGLLVLFAVLKGLLYVGGPNELLVFSGSKSRLPSGEQVNYTWIHGGRHLRIPGLEELDRLDLTVQSVHIHIDGAYSKGVEDSANSEPGIGIPLNVHAIANVKVASEQPYLHNAVERFLGHGSDEIKRVARETLEGNVRSVLAKMTPEEVNENRLKFARNLTEEAEPDFQKLGLHIDTLKIQNVEDERDYLDSIGRERIAEIIRVAEVAESDARKAAEEAEAKARGDGEVARREAQAKIQNGPR